MPTPRQLRRAAERQALKAATHPSSASTHPDPTPHQPTEAQLTANRANAQLSTGPTSPEGKAAVSQNRLSHGLAGQFRLLGWEDEKQYEDLITTLYHEHKPATSAESRLVHSIAQHFWLMQRALTLQDELLAKIQLDHKTFALYLRYQATNERAYYRARRELSILHKERRQQEIGFESQKRQQELHEAKLRLTNARAAASEIETEVRATMEAPLPGHARIPFADVKDAFCATLRDLNKDLEAKAA